jgi:5-oxoprolinase (ATP-hydrolysing)/N-methylhydantoinase A
LDIGGTFTDFVLVDTHSGRVVLHKYLTTYPDSSQGVIAGLRELLALAQTDVRELDEIVHSTTLVTNAIIARRGARTGLLTTAGFRHILDVGREQRYDAYDLFLAYPEPLIASALRREVAERTLADGMILTPVETREVQCAVTELVEQGIESLAVVLLHAYANPTNEQAVAAAVQALYPTLPLSLSSQVAPLMGEWERTSTTVADAYVRPLVDSYLRHLQLELAAMGFQGRFAVMLSTGGAAAPATARAFPIRLLESGPAAGALAGAAVGEQVGLRDLLAFDMGGTTAKVCLIEDGQPHVGHGFEAARVHRFTRGSGLPVAVPSVELIEIGAGGGSIAWRDALGLLQVGPQSAAADPGPACYALGGEQPTVTDANLLLGYLAPDFFLGGRMRLDRELAAAAVGRLADSLAMEVVGCSWGIHQVVNEHMAAAARMHIIERGHDPRRFTLVASGGAGPAHVASVARHLGAQRYVLPAGAGALASFGCLAAPPAFAAERTLIAPLHQVEWTHVRHLYAEMTDDAQTRLAAMGIRAGQIRLAYAVDMRMVGQIHPIQIALALDELNERSHITIAERFHDRYELLFARSNRAMPLEFVNWRLLATGNPPALAPAQLALAATDDPVAACKGNRPAYFAGRGFVSTPVYDRYALQAGMVITGPAIIEERESTAVLPPGDRAVVDKHGNLLVEVRE